MDVSSKTTNLLFIFCWVCQSWKVWVYQSLSRILAALPGIAGYHLAHIEKYCKSSFCYFFHFPFQCYDVSICFFHFSSRFVLFSCCASLIFSDCPDHQPLRPWCLFSWRCLQGAICPPFWGSRIVNFWQGNEYLQLVSWSFNKFAIWVNWMKTSDELEMWKTRLKGSLHSFA